LQTRTPMILKKLELPAAIGLHTNRTPTAWTLKCQGINLGGERYRLRDIGLCRLGFTSLLESRMVNAWERKLGKYDGIYIAGRRSRHESLQPPKKHHSRDPVVSQDHGSRPLGTRRSGGTGRVGPLQRLNRVSLGSR